MRTTEEKSRFFGYIFLLPALVILAAVMGYPILQSLGMGFSTVKIQAGETTSTFVGLENYRRLAGDPVFHTSLKATAWFSVMQVVLVLVLSLATALLLSHPLARSGFFRVILLVPWALSPVANAVLWQWILNANYGALNAGLKALGIIDQNIVWLATPMGALNAVLLVETWKSTPFITLLLLAAISRVPKQHLKAAYLDGANAFQRFIHVTLPGIRGTLMIAIVLQAIWSLRVFDVIYVLTRGGPADATALLNFLAFRTSFSFLDFGYGAAIASIVFFASFVFALVFILLMKPQGRR